MLLGSLLQLLQLLLLLLTPVTAAAVNAPTASHQCQAIPSQMRLCQGVGYSQMRLPNALHQASASEVTQHAAHWLPLAATRCHADLQILLCSVYAPICIPHLEQVGQQIQPCASLCRSVRAACLPSMQRLGFAWPEQVLNCSQFPPETDLMCIKGTTGSGASSEDSLGRNAQSDSAGPTALENNDCDACPKRMTRDDIIGSFCLSEMALKVRLDRVDRSSKGEGDGVLRLRFVNRPRLLGRSSAAAAAAAASASGAAEKLPELAEIPPGCRCQAMEALASTSVLPSRRIRHGRYLLIGALKPSPSPSPLPSAPPAVRVRLLAVWDDVAAAPELKRAVRWIRRSGDSPSRLRSLCSGGGGGGGSSQDDDIKDPLRRRQRRRQRRLRDKRQNPRNPKRKRRQEGQKKRQGRNPDKKRGGRKRGREKDEQGGRSRPVYSYDTYYYVNHNNGRD